MAEVDFGVFDSIAKQLRLLWNIADNKRAIRSSNIQKVHAIQKGEPISHWIPVGNGQYIEVVNKKGLKTQHDIGKRAHNIIQDYDAKYLPAVVQKPVDFFPYRKYDHVGKRQSFVRTAVGQSTDLTVYNPAFASAQAADSGLFGPQISDEQLVENRRTQSKRESDEEYERKSNRERYRRLQASRRKAQREQLYQQAPWMKSIIQSGVINKKNIPAIAKGVDALVKTPGVAAFMKNPLLVGIGAANAIASAENAAAMKFARGRTAEIAFGTTDEKFVSAAKAHGLERATATEMFQKLRQEYGPDALSVATEISASMDGMSGFEKQSVARSLGWDSNMVAALESLRGVGPKDSVASTAERAAIVKEWYDMQKAEGNTATWLFHSLFKEFPSTYTDSQIEGMKKDLEAGARGKADSISLGFNGVVESQEEEAVRSSRPTSYNGERGESSSTTNVDAPITININGNADPDEVRSAVEDGLSAAISRRGVLDNISPKVMA